LHKFKKTMDLSKIIAITGKPGLYKHIAQSKTGIVIESITDGKRTSAFATDQVSSLKDISIFTTGEDIKLEDVLKNIYNKEDGKQILSANSSSSDLTRYFERVLPEYDKERVYISDIKKVIKWYNILAEHNMLEFNDTDESENEETKTEEVSDIDKTDEVSDKE